MPTLTSHDQIVSLTRFDTVEHPIDSTRLTYKKRNYLVATPSKNELVFNKRLQHLDKHKIYASGYVETSSPIFSKESLQVNTMSALCTLKKQVTQKSITNSPLQQNAQQVIAQAYDLDFKSAYKTPGRNSQV